MDCPSTDVQYTQFLPAASVQKRLSLKHCKRHPEHLYPRASRSPILRSMLPEEPQILKTDRRGRIQTPKKHREALLAEFDRSGMSGQKFAAWAGIKYTTFAHWLQRRRKAEPTTLAEQSASLIPAASPQWIEATVEPPPQAGTPTALSIHLPGGARVEVATPSQVALACELLRGMGKRC